MNDDNNDERYALTGPMPEKELRETLQRLYRYFDPEWVGAMVAINPRAPSIISLAVAELERTGHLRE